MLAAPSGLTFGEHNQTLWCGGQTIRRRYSRNGVISRADLFKDDNFPTDHTVGTFGLELISDQPLELLILGHESFPARDRRRVLSSSTRRLKCNRCRWLRCVSQFLA